MPQLLAVYYYGRTTVRVYHGWVETTLPDGTKVSAVGHTGPVDIARAHALGYGGDIWRMTREHDMLHAGLAELLGLHESPVLRSAVADSYDYELVAAEEAAVLAIQRFWNLCRS